MIAISNYKGYTIYFNDEYKVFQTGCDPSLFAANYHELINMIQSRLFIEHIQCEDVKVMSFKHGNRILTIEGNLPDYYTTDLKEYSGNISKSNLGDYYVVTPETIKIFESISDMESKRRRLTEEIERAKKGLKNQRLLDFIYNID